MSIKIGSMARRDIELMLGDRVFLETWVKVKKNWRDKKLDLSNDFVKGREI